MVDTTSDNQNPPRIYLISLIWLSLVAALTSNIQPIFLGVLAESFSLSGSQLGFIGGAELGGSCLASVSAAYWFPRVRLRRAGLFAITVSVLGNLLTSEATDFSQLLLIRFTTGFLGTGVLYALTLGLFGQLKNADRIIAIAVVTHVLSLAVGMSTVPLLMERWQLPGVTVSLAILLSTAFLCLFLLPHRSRYETSKSATSESYNFLGAALLVSLIVFSIGLGSSWAFMERIGSSAGFAMGDIGNALAVSGLIGGFGALMAAVLGTRLGRVLPIVVALTLQVLTCLLLATRNDWYSYLVAIALFNFCWNLTLPYLMGAISAADRSGRFMVLIPAAQTGGYALGPMLVGIFLVGDSFQLAAWVSMSAFIVCLAMIVPLLNRVSRIKE